MTRFSKIAFGRPSTLAIAVALAVPAAVALPATAQAQQAQQDFNIQAGDLATALQRYSAATGVQLVYSSDLVAGKRSPGVSGQMTPQQALGQLLAGSGLSARVSGNTATLVLTGAAGDVAAAEGERLLGPVRVEGSQGGSYQTPVRGEGIARLGGERGRQASEVKGYKPEVATISGGMPIPVVEIPRSVTVLTPEQLEKQDITSIGEALRRAPGVTVVEGVSGADSSIYIRGQSVTTFTVDGGAPRSLTRGALFGNGLLGLDAYDRVELVRGPNAIFTGEGSPGGAINLVRKRPGEMPIQSVKLEGGTYDRIGVITDLSTPTVFGTPIAFRTVASYRSQDSFIEHYGNEQQGLYGIFDIPLGDRARLEIGANFTRDKIDGYYRGALRAASGKLLDVSPFANSDLPVQSKSIKTEIFSNLYVSLSDTWTAEIGVSYDRTRNHLSQLGGSVEFADDGSAIFPGQIYLTMPEKTIGSAFRANAKLAGRFNTFGLTHNFQLQASKSFEQIPQTSSPAIYAVATISSVEDLLAPQFQSLMPSDPSVVYKSSTLGSSYIAIVDNISWRDLVNFNIALRRDVRGQSNAQVFGGFLDFLSTFGASENEARWRPTYSLSIKPHKNVVIFGSHSDGFFRQDNQYSRSGEVGNYTYTMLQPVEYRNIEAGVKVATGKWLASLTGYVLDQKGLGVLIPGQFACPPRINASGAFQGPCYQAGSVSQRSKGFDLELTGEIVRGLGIVANFNYTSAKTKPAAGSSATPEPLITVAPEKAGNVFIDWNPGFAPKLSLQLGASYRGRYYASGFGTIYDENGDFVDSVPYEVSEKGSIVFDFGADYQVTNNIAINARIENIANRLYFSTPPAVYGSPRTFLAGITWRRAKERSNAADDSFAFGRAENWYVALGAGLNIPLDLKTRAMGAAQDGTSDIRWKFDLRDRTAVSARIGYHVADNVRIEVEGQSRGTEFGAVGGNEVAPFGVCGAFSPGLNQPFDCSHVPGNLNVWTLGMNAVYDFGKKDAFLRPYVGAGAGVARANFSFQGKLLGIGPDTPWPAGSSRRYQEIVDATGGSTSPYVQGIVGIEARLTDAFSFDASWRYLVAPKVGTTTFNQEDPLSSGEQPLTPSIGRVRGTYRSNALFVGIKWKLGS